MRRRLVAPLLRKGWENTSSEHLDDLSFSQNMPRCLLMKAPPRCQAGEGSRQSPDPFAHSRRGSKEGSASYPPGFSAPELAVGGRVVRARMAVGPQASERSVGRASKARQRSRRDVGPSRQLKALLQVSEVGPCNEELQQSPTLLDSLGCNFVVIAAIAVAAIAAAAIAVAAEELR